MKNQKVMFLCLIIMISYASSIKLREENMVDSVSYSVAAFNTDSYYSHHSNSFKKPEYVETLPERKPLRGDTAVIEEIKSDANYYDGSKKMRMENKENSVVGESICGEWVSQPEACKKVGNCGWCASSNSCVPGNARGPLKPCQKGAYQFSVPKENWNPFPDEQAVKITRHGKDDVEPSQDHAQEITGIITISPVNQPAVVSEEKKK